MNAIQFYTSDKGYFCGHWKITEHLLDIWCIDCKRIGNFSEGNFLEDLKE
jgi:hypothetical protein